MSKNLSILTILLLVMLPVLGQDDDYIIKPGFGVKNLHIGMDITDIIVKLGEPEHKRTYNETKEWFAKFDDDTKHYPELKLDFDTAYFYDWGAPYTPAPVFSIFTKNSKVVYIRLSYKPYKKRWYKKFSVKGDPAIGFKTKLSENIGEYSVPNKIIDTSYNYREYSYHIFYKKGIGFTYYKRKIITIDIFKPVN